MFPIWISLHTLRPSGGFVASFLAHSSPEIVALRAAGRVLKGGAANGRQLLECDAAA